jgi:hypothetical protein
MIIAEKLARERLELDKKLDYKLNETLYLRYYIPYPGREGFFKICNEDGETLEFNTVTARSLRTALDRLLEEVTLSIP